MTRSISDSVTLSFHHTLIEKGSFPSIGVGSHNRQHIQNLSNASVDKGLELAINGVIQSSVLMLHTFRTFGDNGPPQHLFL